MKRWYAVQESKEDALDYGSYDYEEAYEMAKEITNEKGEAIIAYIDEDADGYCDEEEWVYADEDEELDSEIADSEPFYDLRNGSEKITELDPEESGYHPHLLYNRQEAESLLIKWRDLLGDPDLDFDDVWIDTTSSYYRTEYLGLGKRDSYNTLL